MCSHKFLFNWRTIMKKYGGRKPLLCRMHWKIIYGTKKKKLFTIRTKKIRQCRSFCIIICGVCTSVVLIRTWLINLSGFTSLILQNSGLQCLFLLWRPTTRCLKMKKAITGADSQDLTFQRSIQALENYGHNAELTMIGKKFINALRDSVRFTQQFDPFTARINNSKDGYGSGILAVLEFISRFYGIYITQHRIYWTAMCDQHDYKYEQE